MNDDDKARNAEIDAALGEDKAEMLRIMLHMYAAAPRVLTTSEIADELEIHPMEVNRLVSKATRVGILDTIEREET